MVTSRKGTSIRRRSRTCAALLSLAVVFGITANVARADDKTTCAAAYEKGQDLRNKGEFTSAREQLVICARPSCKDWMVAECTKWLDELERRQPTIVLTAENGRGEVIDLVKVTDESGRAIAEGATGRAIALNPGPHQLTFIARDGSKVTVLKMVEEGQQAVPVRAIFAPPEPARGDGAGGADVRPPSPASPLRTAGWITAGAGIVGVGVGAVFGIVALNKKASAHCDGGGACDAGSTNGIDQVALASTIGFVAGSVLLASGVAMVLFGPTTSPGVARTGSVRLAPTVTTNAGGVVMGGSF